MDTAPTDSLDAPPRDDEVPVGPAPGVPNAQAPQAVRIAVASFALSLLTQYQNYWYFAPRDPDDWADALWFAARLPFILLDHAAFAMAAALCYLVLASRRWSRRVFWVGWTLLQLYVVVDQLGYKLLADHIRRTQVDAELKDTPLHALELLDSAAAEVEPWMWINVGLVVLVALGLARAGGWPPEGPRSPWPSRRLRFAALGVYLALAVPAQMLGDRHNLERHPVVAFVSSFFDTDDPALQRAYSPLLAKQLYRPPFGEYVEAPPDAAALVAAQLRVRVRPRRPLVLLFVMESVGSKQLFTPSGGLSALNTPYLAELAKTSVRFDTLYPSFPSTARSHIPMMTGGPTVTWGDYMQQVGCPYLGPSMMSEMKRLGYRAGVFSPGDLAFEKLGAFYTGLGPERVAYYNDGISGIDPAAKINSWGVSSDEVVRAVDRWLDEGKDRTEPLFVVFFTLETHHPYDFPASHVGPQTGVDKRSKYYNAMSYTDAVLRRLGDVFDRRGLWSDALVLVTGDHGEAFGNIHRGNFVHRNYLYEENLRTFLLVSDRTKLSGELVSHRPGANGDIGPTLVGLLDPAPARMPGQDLMSRDYRLRTLYFHKTATPYRWGLRDGRWKYIAPMAGRGVQLFDLEADPNEQKDVASQHAEQVKLYQELCATWYVKTGYDFTERLHGYTPGADQRVLRSQLREQPEPGIDRVMFGTKSPVDGQFIEPYAFSSTDVVEVQIEWRPYDEPQHVDCVITAPDGTVVRTLFDIEAGAVTTTGLLGLPATTPLQYGTYKVEYSLRGTVLHDTSFDVR